MNILITGIHGFVGSNFVSALKGANNLYGLDIIMPSKEGVIKTFLWENIETISYPLQNLPQFDAIIHLAGKAHDTKNQSAAQSYFDINTGLTQKIFDFFLQSSAKKFIFFSSVKAAADSVVGDILTEDVIPAPIGPYGESKIKAEEYIINKLTVDGEQLTVDNGQLTVTMQHDSAANCQLSTVNCQLIKWYDQEDHTHFDVCADDHCQRYQGITRASTEIVKEAIHATRGQVLTYNGQICDARFSKCCGGAFEEFQYCWEDVKHPYLVKQRDSKTTALLPDLRMEAEAEKWIRSSPEAFCNTTENKILSQVLNNYDQETTDFYRWKVEYTQEELSGLIHRKTGMDFGPIIDLVPLERGSSGRITKLKIVGVRRSFTIGKELEIRRTLSETHLYSSAFVVDKKDIRLDIPSRFILTGAGWGHGVGLCQIGAAVMGAKGYSYRKILTHYFPGATIEKRY